MMPRSRSCVAAACILLAVIGCGPRERSFTGIYISAFETSSFRECGTRSHWWLTDVSGTLGNRLPPGMPRDQARSALLRLRGRLSGQGSYGHLGAYARELTVLEVNDVRTDTTGCP